MSRFLSAVLMLGLLASYVPAAVADDVPTPQQVDFTLTAYYSPLPGQCCYVRGGLEADKLLNGNGTHGADGTPVYPGMLAAPPSYAFGTKIALPGLGVLAVHDRGGAIQILEGGTVHRLDVWMGAGEEGLARALSFGVKHITGTVYPKGTAAPAEDFSLDRVAADYDRLSPYNVVQNGLIDVAPEEGDSGRSVAFLHDHLRTLGYLKADGGSMVFGDATRDALEAFQAAYDLPVDGHALNAETAAMLMAAVRTADRDMDVPLVDEQSSEHDIAAAQRMLRSMGYYKGRTDGRYTDAVRRGIIAFQRQKSLIGDETSPGAGHIGPITRGKITEMLRQKRTRDIARGILLLKRVRDILAARDRLIATTMNEGATGDNVKAVQEFLAHLGYFPAKEVNGVFGPLTKQSVAAYQMARGVIRSDAQAGAGTVGPITLKALQEDQIGTAYHVVRGEGWDAL